MTAEEFVMASCKALECEVHYDTENEEWQLEIHFEGKRKQHVTLFSFEESGRSLVRCVTAVGNANDFSHAQLVTALELNESLLYGAFAIFSGKFVITACTDAVEQEVPRFVEVIRYLTRMADAYEKMVFGLDRG